MYEVWNSIHPEAVREVIAYANSQRYSVDNERVKDNTIEITKEWEDQLQAMPFVSKQKGRMAHLLK